MIVAVVSVVEVETPEMTGGFSTFTVVEAVDVLFDVSVASAQSVVEPFVVLVVLHGMEYNVPEAVVVDPMSVLEAKVPPKDPL